MATLYRKTYPVAKPPGAEIVFCRGRRVARWTDRRGKLKQAPLPKGGRKVIYEAECWYARYTDADGRDRRVSTGCREKDAAAKVLADILAGVERVRSGLVTAAEAKTAEHIHRPVTEHIAEYDEHLRTKRIRGRKVSAAYRSGICQRLKRLAAECRFAKLGDITAESVGRWLEQAEDRGLAAATRNEYLASMHAFCNWAKKTGRLLANPVADIQKADRHSDRRHMRRALTADEVGRLLEATQLRPIAELGRKPMLLPENDRNGRSTWTREPLTPENFDRCYREGLRRLKAEADRYAEQVRRGRHEYKPRRDRRAELEQLGRERAVFYLLAVSTGLRRKELSGLTVGDLHLPSPGRPDTDLPAAGAYIELSGADAKSGKSAMLPLRDDVLAELKAVLAARSRLQRRASMAMAAKGTVGWSIPPGRDAPGVAEASADDLPLDTRLFSYPPTIRVFDADCQAAGIAKTDRRGRVVDIHALRHTFGTHLSAAGVHPRVAMAAMRHSRIELTMNLYTDPVLLDVAGAVKTLPTFSGYQSGARPGRAAVSSLASVER